MPTGVAVLSATTSAGIASLANRQAGAEHQHVATADERPQELLYVA